MTKTKGQVGERCRLGQEMEGREGGTQGGKDRGSKQTGQSVKDYMLDHCHRR